MESVCDIRELEAELVVQPVHIHHADLQYLVHAFKFLMSLVELCMFLLKCTMGFMKDLVPLPRCQCEGGIPLTPEYLLMESASATRNPTSTAVSRVGGQTDAPDSVFRTMRAIHKKNQATERCAAPRQAQSIQSCTRKQQEKPRQQKECNTSSNLALDTAGRCLETWPGNLTLEPWSPKGSSQAPRLPEWCSQGLRLPEQSMT